MAAESTASMITMTLTPLVIMLLTCWACLAGVAARRWRTRRLQSVQSSLTFASKYGLSNFSYRAVTFSGRSRPIDLLPPELVCCRAVVLVVARPCHRRPRRDGHARRRWYR